MRPPVTGDDWTGLSTEPLPVGDALSWVVRPDCGAQVVFTGTVRDHSGDRAEVTALEYEAYEEQVQPRLAAVVADARARWPAIGRVALLHRVGRLALGEPAVVVAVSSPHRPEAFAAARFCIDTLKATVPIWKKETWVDGEAWGLDAHAVEPVGRDRS